MDGRRFFRAHPELPIFAAQWRGRMVFATGGHVAVLAESDARSVAGSWTGRGRLESGVAAEARAWLEAHARDVVSGRAVRVDRSCSPVCLTLHMSADCLLECVYCYARPERGPAAWNMDAMARAVEAVADNCARQAEPFTLAFHGGGEPSREWDVLTGAVGLAKRVVRDRGLGWRGYAATGGACGVDRARWLAANLGEVGLSCDGPPDIQDAQRPLAGGGATSGMVESVARAVREEGGRLSVRATVLPGTLHRMSEVVEYAAGVLGADVARLEPVYRAGARGFAPEQAEAFAAGFVAARRAGTRLGIVVETSCCRPEEVHGPYCEPARRVLRLLPDGTVAGCFVNPRRAETISGRTTAEGVQWREKAARDLCRSALEIPGECRDCVCAHSCVRTCPEACPALGETGRGPAALFRCRAARLIGEKLLLEAAGKLVSADGDAGTGGSGAARLSRATKGLPSELADEVFRQWEAARHEYDVNDSRLPEPPWERRGLDRTPEEAALLLERHSESSGRPVSVYVHIPFCEGRCGFCDCRSVDMGDLGPGSLERYVGALCGEIEREAAVRGPGRRPVTTVHFGGGTPGVLPGNLLEEVVRTLSSAYRVHEGTQWAMETTCRTLANGAAGTLRGLGFTRLHLGVQTLDPESRGWMGRKLNPAAVLSVIERCASRGFITTADLVYGIPGAGARGVVRDVAGLLDAGAHGVSLYRLNRSRRNRRHVPQPGPDDAVAAFASLVAADALLAGRGFSKTHFAHWSGPGDDNLYFTHAARGEDLAAHGAWACGRLGDFLFRRRGPAAYLEPEGAGQTLAGGMVAPPEPPSLARARAMLMASRIAPRSAGGPVPDRISSAWLRAGLTRPEAPGAYTLTGSGTWLVDRMIRDLERAARFRNASDI